MKTGKLVLGTLAGFAIGAIAGILFAPAKGSKTRKRIMKRHNAFVDEAKSKLGDARISIADKFQNTKRNAVNLVDYGNDQYEDAKKDIKIAAAKFKHDGKPDTKHPTM